MTVTPTNLFHVIMHYIHVRLRKIRFQIDFFQKVRDKFKVINNKKKQQLLPSTTMETYHKTLPPWNKQGYIQTLLITHKETTCSNNHNTIPQRYIYKCILFYHCSYQSWQWEIQSILSFGCFYSGLLHGQYHSFVLLSGSYSWYVFQFLIYLLLLYHTVLYCMSHSFIT